MTLRDLIAIAVSKNQQKLGSIAKRSSIPEVAKLMGMAGETRRPLPGRGKGMLTILSDDDDHLKDFAEYIRK